MEEVIKARLRKIDQIDSFLKNVEKDISVNLRSLGWNVDKIKENKNVNVMCPYNKSHMISNENYEEHCKKCKVASEGYKRDEILFPENCNVSSNTITLDSNLISSIVKRATNGNEIPYTGMDNSTPRMMNRVIPQNYDRIMSTFTREQRLALYDYVVSLRPHIDDTINDKYYMSSLPQNEPNSPKSHLKELAETRDLKRRRTKYKVSTKSKTYTQVIREVIQNQMAEYASYLDSKQNVSTENKYYPSGNNTRDDDNYHRKKTKKYSDSTGSKSHKYDYYIDARNDTKLQDKETTKHYSRSHSKDSSNYSRKHDIDRQHRKEGGHSRSHKRHK